MTEPGFDRHISAWLDERAQLHAPDGLLADTLERTARIRARPAWRIPERWIPMPTSIRLALIPRSAIVLVVLLVAALFGAAIAVASQPSGPPLPPPTGVARNGLLAWDAGGDIWVANPDGSDPHAITSGPGVDINPTFSPDGTLLAYWSLVDLSPEIPLTQTRVSLLVSRSTQSLVVVRPDGTDPMVLVEGVRPDRAGLPVSWAPDSRRLVYSILDGSGSPVQIVSVDGGPPVTIAQGEAPTWSPDGSLIAYRGLAIPSGVMVVRPDGTDAHQVTAARGSGYAFMLPQWSPDASRITFYAAADGAHDIWIADADGSNERALSTELADEFWPYWSPDGSRIAFMTAGTDPQQVMGNYSVIDPDGGERLELALGSMAGGAPTIWSPDGTMILGFLAGPPEGMEAGLVLLDAAGGDPLVRASVPAQSPWNSGSWQRLAP